MSESVTRAVFGIKAWSQTVRGDQPAGTLVWGEGEILEFSM
jgi:hypothetical protein